MRGNGLTSLVVCHHGLTVRFLERRIQMLSLRPGKNLLADLVTGQLASH